MGDVSKRLQMILRELDHYDSLPEDWVGDIIDDDGKEYSTGRPSVEVLNQARQFFKMLPNFLMVKTNPEDIVHDMGAQLNVFWDGKNGEQMVVFFTQEGVFLYADFNEGGGDETNDIAFGVGECVLNIEVRKEKILGMFKKQHGIHVSDINSFGKEREDEKKEEL